MAVEGTLTNARKMKWIIYMIAALAVGAWGIYDGWFNPAYQVPEKAGDQFFSRMLGIGLPAIFMAFLIGFFVIRKTRVMADEKGITVNGKFTIDWASMTAMDDSRVEKGLLDIFYDRDGKELKYVLDSYKVTHFDELLDEISVHRPDLLPPVEEAEAPQGADEEEKE